MKIFKISGIILIICVLFYIITIYFINRVVYPITYKELVIKEAKKEQIDPYLIFAVIKKESAFDKDAISSKGAKGLMQVMDKTAKDIVKNNSNRFTNPDKYNIFDEKTNITIGTIYLKQLLNRYDNNLTMALAAYNAGLGNVDKWKTDNSIYVNEELIIENIPFKETKDYVKKVLNSYEKYKRIYNI